MCIRDSMSCSRLNRRVLICDHIFTGTSNDCINGFIAIKNNVIEKVGRLDELEAYVDVYKRQALDTDIKTWANAQGWKLSDENEAVDIFVDYDFDADDIVEGVYHISFSTTGRELKIHTTDYVEEGKEVGLTFFPEDIHVMGKMGF